MPDEQNPEDIQLTYGQEAVDLLNIPQGDKRLQVIKTNLSDAIDIIKDRLIDNVSTTENEALLVSAIGHIVDAAHAVTQAITEAQE